MKNLTDVAMGKLKADVVFKNANVVDVFSRNVYLGDVAICGNVIAGVGKYSGETEIDCTGKYICPGLIDSHVHVESSMLTPGGYASAVVPWGITSVVADPHEITNVCGEDGIAYMQESAKNSPLDFYFMMPSCVPSTPFDSAGAVIDSIKTKEMISKYNFLGLAEMMNYIGVINGDKEVLAKIKTADIVDGHCPGLAGNELNAYVSTGIMTDHECFTKEEALEKIRRGMYVLIRQGTGAKNLSELIRAVTPQNLSRFCFCTDDKHIDDIDKEGTINNCINLAVKQGMDPVDAITIATNGFRCYNIKGRGAVAPGYFADLLICDSINEFCVNSVYKNGVLVAKNGTCLFKIKSYKDSKVTNTVNIGQISDSQLVCEFDPKKPVIEIINNSLITKAKYVKNTDKLCHCAVVERYKASGNIGKCYVSGVEIKNGAIAQSIGHDCHNITVVGDNKENMLAAVKALGKDGGIAVVKNGEELCVIKLPVAGLMSDKTKEEVLLLNKELLAAVKSICENGSSSLLMIMSFLSLVVIPDLKINHKGLFDVIKQQNI